MNTGAFITCRLASTRLPRKHLLPVESRPLMEYLIERIKCSEKIKRIFICTTTNKEDQELVELAIKNKIEFFCGSENDIIKRHLDCANSNDIDLIISVDGDDIFCDYNYMDNIIEAFENDQNMDIVKTYGLPFGMNSMGYKRQVLSDIINLRGNECSDTGWGIYFDNPDLFRILKLKAPEAFNRQEIRATLDYTDDYEFFKTVIKELYCEGKMFTTEDIIQLIEKDKSIAMINNHLNEEYWENFNKKKAKQLEV